MFWFQGSIPDAISSAKRRSLIFVVVIAGDDEQSAQLMSSWEDDRVSEEAHRSCVAIKVDAKSDTCVQFSQIYPVVCIPSSFFIGDNGIPLEVIAGSVSPDELLKRINKVQQMHIQELGSAGTVTQPSAPVQTTPPATVPASASTPEGPVGSESAASEPGAEPQLGKGFVSSTVEDGRPSNTQPPAASSAQAAEENLDSKVERLTKKLEEKREQRKKGEEENEIRKEMERRKMGKNVQDFKRKQEEDNNKRILEERNREKAEEKAARERVRQQIAMDRADRAARYAKTQEDEKAAKQALLQSRQADQEAKKETALRERSTIARIQFRLPDGSSFTNQFSPQSRLQEAWDFAAERVGNRYGHFALATMFPRREFTNEDLSRSLVDLELTPSSSVVLLPSGRPANTVVQSSGSGIWAALGTLLYPLLAVWRFLSSFFVTPAPSASASRNPGQHFSSHTNSNSSNATKAKREIPSKHSLENQPRDFKKDGKICRLRTQEDNEDDNNTWNGNSTQQM
ncbi:UBX domain-containing protein 4 isoform X2 [Kryptolebias marmoratus]|uniref:UBX domain-containing protein 4 isoform X2 n=1 Tax=Kryptolebias marmoratus TaxID=37003 RepID=UPI0007F9056D|nr:UBX domain-containing protein 4 isoform X2 [Kryptolebias marmoratus]